MVGHSADKTVGNSLWTFAVYVGSSIYTSSQEQVVEIFGLDHVQGALGLALYVLVSTPSQHPFLSVLQTN